MSVEVVFGSVVFARFALPLLIPLVIVLMRQLRRNEVTI